MPQYYSGWQQAVGKERLAVGKQSADRAIANC
jgi:hypothetical protein